MRPRPFLDTNICIHVANGNIAPAEWRRVQSRINSGYRYCISFIALKELFSKLARGSEAYFERNKGALKVLDAPSKKTFLPYPSLFALRTVLRNETAARIYRPMSHEQFVQYATERPDVGTLVLGRRLAISRDIVLVQAPQRSY